MLTSGSLGIGSVTPSDSEIVVRSVRLSSPAEAAKPRLSRRRARHTEKTRDFKSGRDNPRRMCVERCHLTRMIATKEGRVRRCMSNSWRRSIFCGLAGVLATGGLMFSFGAQQPSAGAPFSSAAHRDVINRYFLSCHNDRLKRGGLALDTGAV